ncbi:MAG: adenylosuccinate lyase [Bdellovibrionales bacterium]
MIDRYTRQEMGSLWTPEARFRKLLEVEIAVADAQSSKGIIPKSAALQIRKKADFKYERILEIEKTTKHDVIAFVSAVAEEVGDAGKYLHYGLTSSDALDTALSLQLKQSWDVLKPNLKSLDKVFIKLIKKYKTSLCTGRTHGMHAEPTSFGFKVAGFHAEYRRNLDRLEKAFKSCFICKLSGAVGTYSFLSPSLESQVAKTLGLKPETIATQVIPRDRLADLFNAIALLGGGFERIAIELRHLQRTEVAEVFEGFSSGQKGSSAMPHKKNPISAENITGGARMLRAFAQTGLENIALWHERDISHSSTERVFLTDAIVLSDYLVARMDRLLGSLALDEERMLSNMNQSKGSLFSSHLLLALVDKGESREEAYKEVQRLSHSLSHGEHLKVKALADNYVSQILSAPDIEKVFRGDRHKKAIEKKLTSYLKSLKAPRL